MSRTTSTGRLGILAAAALAGAAVTAPSALGAVVPVDDGQTNLHLDAATAGALGDLGVSVSPVGPATAKGLRLSFPIDGGRIDPETAAGVVDHEGGLAFRAGGTTVRVTDFTVRTDVRRPHLTARVGGGSIRLLNLDLSDARVIRRGPGEVGTWAVRIKSTLSAQAAAALNAAFGSRLAGGIPIGRVDLRAFPAEVRFDGGATTLALDPGTAQALAGLGVTPSVIPPATAGPAGLAFPITGGRLPTGEIGGEIPHSGGIALTAGAIRVELRNFIIDLDADRPVLTAQVGDTSTRVPLALDLAAAKIGLSNGKAVITGAKVALSPEAASALNAAFRTSALTAGLALGSARVVAQVI
ncbi:MAG TPA: hypothetical protein VK904_08765 [Miltoncostaeaceae bacterium]|nr:hypothetical protein [Miltoncostaeaceae bacterium]